MEDVRDEALWPASPPPDTRVTASELGAIDQLVRDLQAGRAPETNFQRLFESKCASITYFFSNRGFSEHEAEDLTQEVFLKVHRNIRSFRFESSFSTWLFQIASNAWKNTLRGQKTAKRQAESVSLDVLMEPDLESVGTIEPDNRLEDPLKKVLAEERTRLLHDALQELPPRMRECVFFRVGQGLRYREIADLMQISAATVKSQLREAHKRLKALLEQHLDVFIL